MSEIIDADADSSPEAILDAALDEFAERGFAGARIDEIARRAGVNKAGLYYHVGNKEKLYLLSLRRLFTPLASAMAEPLPQGTPAERLRAHVTQVAREVIADPRFAPILLRELADRGANLPGEILAVMIGALKRLTLVMEEGVKAGVFRPVPPPLIQFMLVGALNFSVVTAPVRQRATSEGMIAEGHMSLPDAAGLANQLADMLLNGLTTSKE